MYFCPARASGRATATSALFYTLLYIMKVFTLMMSFAEFMTFSLTGIPILRIFSIPWRLALFSQAILRLFARICDFISSALDWCSFCLDYVGLFEF